MATDSNTLMDQAKCIDCVMPEGMKLSVLIVIFAQIANVSTDPNFLMDMAKCIDCTIPEGMKMSVLLALADKLNNS